MENLINDQLMDRLSEEFDLAWSDDIDLRNALAEHLLEGVDYYLYCKDDAQGYLDAYEDDVFTKVIEEYFDSDGTIDIREFVEKAYNIEIGA